MTSFIVTIDRESVSRLRRASAELGRPIEDLIATAAEEAALEYAKSRGWPVGSSSTESWSSQTQLDL